MTATYLAGTINASVTALTVRGTAEFPASGSFDVVIDAERMTVTAGAGTTSWSGIARGVQGTTAASHLDGSTVYLVASALTVAEFREHVPSSLADGAIQRYLNANAAAITAEFGPPGTITLVRYPENDVFLMLDRPISSITSITEFYNDPIGISGVLLDATDYRIQANGTILERWGYGTHPADWWSRRVELLYVPVDLAAERIRVLVKLTELDLNRSPGLATLRVGEYAEQHRGEKSYDEERADILATLRPSAFVFA